MATVAQLEAALMKADAAGDEAAAREIAAEIKRARTAKPAKQRAKTGRAEAIVSGIERGMQPIAQALEYLNPLSYIMPAKPSEAATQRLQTQAQRARQDRPNYFTGGKIAGEIAATAPLIAAGGGAIQAGGRVLSTVAPRAGRVVQRVGAATRTGGIGSGRTAAQTAALTKGQRAGQLAERMAGGAIAGGAGAGLTGQDITEGAAFGAGLPIVGSIIGRLGGKAVDLTRISKLKAAKIIREALGEDIGAAKAAFRELSPDDQRLAQQVLIEAGVEPSPFFGLGQIVTREMDPDTTARILAQQEAARTARLAEAAGGETATMQRSAAEIGRRTVTEATGPTREVALARANVAGQVVRDAEDVAADLAAEGMQPLTVAPITQSIRAMAAAPGTRASKLQRRALVTAANQLDALADANGVIDARDLYQFRKSELGDIVNVLLSGRNMPPSGVKEGAAKLMGDIRPMIDDAIESAGGVGFKDYLARTRQGFEAINRQELAARGAQLAKESPGEFTALMRGERPKIVEDIMGKGTKQYDIGGMALADPARYLAMKTSADELETLNKMAQLGARGEPRAGNILRGQQPGLLSRGLGTLVRAKYPAVAFAGTGAQNVESALVSPNVQREIANAFTSGRGALQAIEQYPTAAQFSAYLSTLPSPVRNAFAQAMRAYAQQPSH